MSLDFGEVLTAIIKTHWYLVRHPNIEVVNHHEKV
jgi:hypothetical protein